MKQIRCAIIESHSWPAAGSQDEGVYGFRNYKFTSECHNYDVQIDIVPPFQDLQRSYHYYFISDELCASGFPYFMPLSHRVAFLKESPKYISPLNHNFIAKSFPVAITNLKYLSDKFSNYILSPFSSNFIGAYPNNYSALAEPYKKTRPCSMIASLSHDLSEDGYAFRNLIFKTAQRYSFIELYGKPFNPILLKKQALDPYCFSIAMENTQEDYYFSEKIIDCFLTKTIPIYYGCPSIDNYFDPRGILSFSNENDFVDILDNVSLDFYNELLPFAEKNFKIALDSNFASFEDFLKRSFMSIVLHSPPSDEPFTLTYSLQSKFMRRMRLYASMLANK